MNLGSIKFDVALMNDDLGEVISLTLFLKANPNIAMAYLAAQHKKSFDLKSRP